MEPTTHRVHTEYVLVKSMLPWSMFNSLPWLLSQEKISLHFRDGWCGHLLSEAEVILLPLYMGVAYHVTSSSALNPITVARPTKWHLITTRKIFRQAKNKSKNKSLSKKWRSDKNCLQGHTKEFENTTVYRQNFLLVQFNAFRLI